MTSPTKGLTFTHGIKRPPCFTTHLSKAGLWTFWFPHVGPFFLLRLQRNILYFWVLWASEKQTKRCLILTPSQALIYHALPMVLWFMVNLLCVLFPMFLWFSLVNLPCLPVVCGWFTCFLRKKTGKQTADPRPCPEQFSARMMRMKQFLREANRKNLPWEWGASCLPKRICFNWVGASMCFRLVFPFGAFMWCFQFVFSFGASMLSFNLLKIIWVKQIDRWLQKEVASICLRMCVWFIILPGFEQNLSLEFSPGNLSEWNAEIGVMREVGVRGTLSIRVEGSR